MTSTTKRNKKLPAGWQIIVNIDDVAANIFVERCIAEFNSLFGLYTRSDTQKVVLEDAPGDVELERARTILHNQGRRNILHWVDDSVKGRVVCLEIFPPQKAVA